MYANASKVLGNLFTFENRGFPFQSCIDVSILHFPFFEERAHACPAIIASCTNTMYCSMATSTLLCKCWKFRKSCRRFSRSQVHIASKPPLLVRGTPLRVLLCRSKFMSRDWKLRFLRPSLVRRPAHRPNAFYLFGEKYTCVVK